MSSSIEIRLKYRTYLLVPLDEVMYEWFLYRKDIDELVNDILI